MRDDESTHSTPRWVKSGIIVFGLLLLFDGLHLAGRSLPGPGFGYGGHAPLSSAGERGPQPP